MARFIDLQVRQDSDGIFDLVIDEPAADFAVVDGLEPAIIASLFSDRRAASDEVSDPLKRRGWIGNLVSEVAGDNFGSGLWLYEQRRLSGDVISGLRLEAEQSMAWMIDMRLAAGVEARVLAVPAKRQTLMAIDIIETSGDTTSFAYRLADATQRGLAANIGGEPAVRQTIGRDDDVLEWMGEKLTWRGAVLEWD